MISTSLIARETDDPPVSDSIFETFLWALELTVFYVVFNIAVPIVLVDLIFPIQRSES